MKKIRPYLLGILLAWAMVFMAACGSTDSQQPSSATSEGAAVQTTQSEKTSSGEDPSDKRSGKLFMLCKIQDLMRRIVKIRQNHPPELFFPFIHLSSSGELTADFDCFENAPGGDVSTTQPGARLEGSLLLYPGRNAGTTFRTSGGHPDMNPVRRESDSINSPPSRGKE